MGLKSRVLRGLKGWALGALRALKIKGLKGLKGFKGFEGLAGFKGLECPYYHSQKDRRHLPANAVKALQSQGTFERFDHKIGANNQFIDKLWLQKFKNELLTPK